MNEPPPVNSQAELDALPFMQQRTYTKDYERYQKKKEVLQKNLSKLYQNLWDACQPNLIQKIRRHPSFDMEQPNVGHEDRDKNE